MVIETEAVLQVSFFVIVPVTVLFVIAIVERRCGQVQVMNIVIFALYGLVMNPTPP